jgi:hypothetical protein
MMGDHKPSKARRRWLRLPVAALAALAALLVFGPAQWPPPPLPQPPPPLPPPSAPPPSAPPPSSQGSPEPGPPETTARRVARDDAALARGARPAFSGGARPLIRWVKGAGLDDAVTRAAIGQATRLLGARVDYALATTPGFPAARARDVLSWATQPVEWWQLSPADNLELAQALWRARVTDFGHWWRWFPGGPRGRGDAPRKGPVRPQDGRRGGDPGVKPVHSPCSSSAIAWAVARTAKPAAGST